MGTQTSGMLRVNSNAVLVVPPFECAWLQGTESIQSGCCVSFDVKGGLSKRDHCILAPPNARVSGPSMHTELLHCQHDSISHNAGENDVTIILKSEAGGRRWQHFAHNGGNGVGPDAGGAQHPAHPQRRTERNYTVILGSHRNSCIKVEKDGQLCDRVG